MAFLSPSSPEAQPVPGRFTCTWGHAVPSDHPLSSEGWGLCGVLALFLEGPLCVGVSCILINFVYPSQAGENSNVL